MATDEGTPKRRRGLFRRDRTDNEATTQEPRTSADGFDDPWSASAWDDWDDDFTNGGQRSSVPAAAAPRPEAVDAWLQSEANDFDDAARKNTKRWGGDANRGTAATPPAPTMGLAGARSLGDSPGGSSSPSSAPSPSSPSSDALPEAVIEVHEFTGVNGVNEVTVDTDSWSATEESSPSGTDNGSSVVANTTSDLDSSWELPTTQRTDDNTDNTDNTDDTDDDTVADDNTADDTDTDEFISADADDEVADPGSLAEGAGFVEAHVEDPTFVEQSTNVTEPIIAGAPAEQLVLPVSPALAGQFATDPDDLIDDLSMVDDTGPDEDEHDVAGDELMAKDTGPDEDEHDVAGDELMATDALGVDPHDLDDLVNLDAEPTQIAAATPSWAPSPSGRPRNTQHLPSQLEVPVTQVSVAPVPDLASGGSASRFVSVSVVTDEDRAAAAISAAAETAPNPARGASRNEPVEPMAVEPAGVDGTVDARTVVAAGRPPSDSPAPAHRTGSRWAELAAEFDSDGDLDDSFPRRPAPIVGRTATSPSRPTIAFDEPPARNIAPSSVEPRSNSAAPAATSAPAQPTTADADDSAAVAAAVVVSSAPEDDPWDRPPRADPASAAAEPPLVAPVAPTTVGPIEDADPDPWARPPVSLPDNAAKTLRPARSRPDVSATDGARRQRRPQPAATTTQVPTPAKVQAQPLTHAEPEAPLATIAADSALSSFSGLVGTALVAFAALRIGLTLLGDQPFVAQAFTGMEAKLLRVGESFASAGTAWPIALVGGTILLALPGFLGMTHHLRKWSPILGVAAATALIGAAAGALRFRSGRKLKSGSTVSLVADALIGPVGLGLLTIVVVVLAARAAKRR